jgi:hypothetical protein
MKQSRFGSLAVLLLSTPAWGAGATTGQVGPVCQEDHETGLAEPVELEIDLALTNPYQLPREQLECIQTAQQIQQVRSTGGTIVSAEQFYQARAPERLAAAEASLARSSAGLPTSDGTSKPSSSTPEAPITETRGAPAAVSDVIQAAARQGLVDDAGQIVAARERAAAARSTSLIAQYASASPAQVSQSLSQSEQQLREMARALRENQAQTEEAQRLARSARDAADRAQRAREWLDDQRSAASTGEANIPLFSPTSPIPWSGSGAMGSLFAPPSAGASAMTSDEYARQLALLAGLPEDVRARLLANIDTIEVMVNGRRVRMPRLGALMEYADRSLASASGIGGGSLDSALPCAAFLANAMPDELSRSKLTTLDWISVFNFRQSGSFPDRPQYTAERRRLIQDLAQHFDPIDAYRGNRPVPGDLIIHRIPGEDSGRLLMVRNYDPNTGSVEAMEFSPMSRKPANVQFSVRKGSGAEADLIDHLFVLRIRQGANGRCELHAAQPSSDPRST